MIDYDAVRLRGLTTITMPVFNRSLTDSYILKDIDGYDVDFDLAFADTPDDDSLYLSRTPHDKELVLTIGLNPNPSQSETVRTLRNNFYGIVSPGSDPKVVLELLKNGTVLAKLDCYTKKLTPNPFSKTPEIVLTLGSPKTRFEAPSETLLTNLWNVNPSFTYLGDASTGFRAEFTFTDAVSSFYIYSSDLAKFIRISTSFAAGDKFLLNTNPGSKSVAKQLSGQIVKSDIIGYLSTDSTWLELYNGANSFTFNTNKFTFDRLYYTPKYWGP